MEASLDTCAIIDLYNANQQNILFRRFKKVLIYEFIRNPEMKNHAQSKVLELFDADVESGKIKIICDNDLKRIQMFDIFQSHVKENKILYDPGNLGEVYAIALAKTLGCIVLVTDDIKERGPHYTLMRSIDSDVIPLTFYEILFLDYLENWITEDDFKYYFDTINNTSNLNKNCNKELKNFIKRFWDNPGSEREKVWMNKFCRERGINAKERLRNLICFLSNKQ